jgi:hypothetical protein
MDARRPSDFPTQPPPFDLETYARRSCSGHAIVPPPLPAPAGSIPPSDEADTVSPPMDFSVVPALCDGGSVSLEALHLLLQVDGVSSLATIADRARTTPERVSEVFASLERAGIVSVAPPRTSTIRQILGRLDSDADRLALDSNRKASGQ